jgi:hypothetical protein
MLLSKITHRMPLLNAVHSSFSIANETTFLQMVREYYDKAGEAAGIPKDRVNFLKSPDFSLKFNIPFLTGKSNNNQMQDLLKSFRPIESNTKLTNYLPKVERDMQAASI